VGKSGPQRIGLLPDGMGTPAGRGARTWLRRGRDPEVPREVEKARRHLRREKRAGRVVERERDLFTLALGAAVVGG
jgi:hypothetical protein